MEIDESSGESGSNPIQNHYEDDATACDDVEMDDITSTVVCGKPPKDTFRQKYGGAPNLLTAISSKTHHSMTCSSLHFQP